MRILRADDVRQAVPMAAAIDAVQAAFAALSSGNADVPLRTHLQIAAESADSFVMPASVRGETPALGMKLVSVFPNNVSNHLLPNINAVVMLLDPRTGKPAALLDGTYLTALRTGAASGVATRLLAQPEARSLALFGAGAQALPQVQAVCAVRPIDNIWLVNRTRDRAAILAARLRSEGYSGDIRIADSPERALAEAEIVCTVTTSLMPLFADAAVRAGTHINGVGAYRADMAEIPAATVARALVFVDQTSAAWAEAGDLIQAREAGVFSPEQVAAEIGAVAAGLHAGRTDPAQITFFKSVGNAVQDLAVAQLALLRASELGLGTEIEL